MGWFNWLVLAEEIAEPEEGDGKRLTDKRAPGFLGITQDEWTKAKHQGNVDASLEGELDERIERKLKQGKSWW